MRLSRLSIVFLCVIAMFQFGNVNSCAANTVISGGVSLTDSVPSGFFGAWKVVSVLSKTNNSQMFAPYSVDIWNLSRQNGVITLSNPVSGARASISVDEVRGDTVRFKKKSYDIDEESIETPVLTLNGDNFRGTDRIEVKTYQKGQLVKTEFVEYNIVAFKMSGATVPDIFE
ncbi:MAG: hypothetical protein PHV37_03200 [Candidatus Gastranaerophilales bacterium]|nr:hypothetical protein [Candidatus Gastranaerophilales bacterium]